VFDKVVKQNNITLALDLDLVNCIILNVLNLFWPTFVFLITGFGSNLVLNFNTKFRASYCDYVLKKLKI
jgi:hypothetical protein